ncbi:hypothetical protein Lesp02_85280 [Lentzea sp. NBRC 105346]|uniref:hypothetical protein n=1 Tax=Lentzea sp. NBRC 105346 TaxID=3032205 RepID=UPI0024A0CF40|nr:hypothetical protein [Lentzea sp. NBRC 105346]GLZ36341.1 hypothetical protein Lesp02_85280 [Lentzea sp. NBRC 105346]
MTPRVVCLCGSMRFEREIRAVAIDESLSGAIVLLPLVNLNHPHQAWGSPLRDIDGIKADLDRLHLAKIDQADEVIVVCPGGYIGDSTAREIAYAHQQGKPVRHHRVVSRVPDVLDRIADLVPACPPPDIAQGYDPCPCGRGQSWPCSLTRAAWLARGLDVHDEIRAACQVAANKWPMTSEEGVR